MQYLLLIYNDEREWAALGEEARGEIVEEFFAVRRELQDAGAWIASAPLRSTETALAVRVREGNQVVTDGPFAETKEQLGGYFLIDVGSDEEAVRWAAKIPAARYGTVEVRPVLEIGVPA